MQITLNGGNFGGQNINTDNEKTATNEAGETLIEMTDALGVWLYSIDRHKQTQTADFVGMKD